MFFVTTLNGQGLSRTQVKRSTRQELERHKTRTGNQGTFGQRAGCNGLLGRTVLLLQPGALWG